MSNDELKKKNAMILCRLSDLLGSDDEQRFLIGATRITKFIERKEAYYAEARQVVSYLVCHNSLSTKLESSMQIFSRLTLIAIRLPS